MNVFPSLGLAAGALSLAFLGLYFFARRIDNYGIVDIAWSYAFGVVAVAFALTQDGWIVRRAGIALLVLIWSGRLGTHLWVRICRHHPQEDARYRKLRDEWSTNFAPKMAGFFQLQAFSVVLLGLPFLLSTANRSPCLHGLERAATILWLVGFAGEVTADAQLAAFKRNVPDSRRVCDVGLWRYSRHPNYFFEWLIWVAYALFALPSAFGWLGFVSPACILWLLLRVTGIPMTEEQSLRSKGDAFRDYQRKTSAFVPWFPQK